MPSVEEIRTLTIKANTQGLAESTQQIQALTNAVSETQGILAGMTKDFGLLGDMMGALGAGGGIAIAIAAMNALTKAAGEAGDKAIAITDLAELVGLSVVQVQALQSAAGELGSTTGDVANGLKHLSTQLEGVRNGGGRLFDVLMRVNAPLTVQLQTTKNLSGQLTILAKLYELAGINGNKLAQVALGNAKLGPNLLGPINENGGTTGTVREERGNLVATPEEIQSWSDLKKEINTTQQHIKDQFESLFAGSMLAGQLSFYESVSRFADAIKDYKMSGDTQKLIDFLVGDTKKGLIGQAADYVKDAAPKAVGAIRTFADNNLSDEFNKNDRKTIGRELGGGLNAIIADVTRFRDEYWKGTDRDPNTATNPHTQPPTLKNSFGPGSTSVSDWNNYTNAVLKSAGAIKEVNDENEKIPPTTEAVLAAHSKIMNALGGAASAAERMAQEDAKLANMKGVPADIIARAKEYSDVQINGAQIAARAALGLATATEIEKQKFDDLNTKLHSGIIKSTDEYTASLIAATKRAKELKNSSEQAGSNFPNLVRLGQEATDVNKQFDNFAVSGVNNLSTAMVDVINHSGTMGEVFQKLGVTVARSLQEIIIKMLLMRAIGGAMGMFSGVPSAATDVNNGYVPYVDGGGTFPTRGAGGMVDGNGPYASFGGGGIVGAPELIQAHKGEGVFTPGQMAAMGGAGSDFTINVINQNGSNVEVAKRKDSNGNITADVFVKNVVKDGFANNDFTSSMNSRTRAPQRVTRR